MKKGFFTIDNEEGYDFLENLLVGNKEMDALYYLHGLCHEFALALNETLGYEIVLWVNYDEDISCNKLVHAFNTFEHKGTHYYVDVRGITDNIKDIIDEFDYFDNFVSPVSHNLKRAKNILKELNLNISVSNDVYKLINVYKTNYQLND
ncbi:hypothetical protein ACV3UL_14415 [Clostridium perfringens]